MAEIIWDSELGPSWPDDWSHTTVHAQFVAVTGDGADTDRLPDIAPSGNGEVIFTPSLRTVRYVGADGPYVVSLKQYRAVVDSEGYLCTPDTFGQPGERGIVLPSTDAPVIEPRGEDDNAFTWRVDFDIPAVTHRSDHIAVPVDGPYNLVDLLSPERAAGVVHIIDRVSARDAIQAAQEATAARDLVLPARDQTLAARDETLQHGVTVDTSVGTRVYVGNTMIHGDTGWRAICRWQDGEVTEGDLPSKLAPNGSQNGGIFITRVNNEVTIGIVEAAVVDDNPEIPLPVGWRGRSPMPYPAIPIFYRDSSGAPQLANAEFGATLVRYRGVPAGAQLSTVGAGGYGVMVTAPAASSWPSSQIGTPR